MEAADASRVLALINLIHEYKQAIELIDAGAKITAMTLMRPEPEPVPPEEPVGVAEDEEEDPDAPTPRPPEEEEPVEAPEEDTTLREATISTEQLIYPPQMMENIRRQEVELWQAAYDELARLGVTNVPPPAEATPVTAQPLPHRQPPPPARAARPGRAPLPPPPPTGPLGRRR